MPVINRAEIDRRLTPQAPTPEQDRLIRVITEAAKLFGHVIADDCPEGREKSLAVTYLEEAKSRAIRAVVLD